MGGKDWVTKDARGRASVPLDYACLRCHNDSGNVFADSAGITPLTARTIAQAAAVLPIH